MLKLTHKIILTLFVLINYALLYHSPALAQNAEPLPEGEGVDSQNQNNEETFSPSWELMSQSLVEFRTGFAGGYGFLVRDRRTVVVPAGYDNPIDRGRPILFRMLGTDDPLVDSTRMYLFENWEGGPFVFELDEDLEGTPLALSEEQINVDDLVNVFTYAEPTEHSRPVRNRPEGLESQQVIILSVSPTHLRVNVRQDMIWHGSPILDESGRVIAFFGTYGDSIRVQSVFTEGNINTEQLSTYRESVSFDFGIKHIFAVVEGAFGAGFDFNVGMLVLDRLGIHGVVSLVLTDLDSGQELVQAPSSTDYEGMIRPAGFLSYCLFGLELSYHQRLFASEYPVYIDFALSGFALLKTTSYDDTTMYSTVANCDPFAGEDCQMVEDTSPEGFNEVFGGMGVGIDFRYWITIIGYRLNITFSENPIFMHQILLGVQM